MHTLQHQLSNGRWVDTDNTNQGLDLCVKFNANINNHNEAIAAMESGRELRNDSADWYSNTRLFDAEAHEKKIQEHYEKENNHNKTMITCRGCGQQGHAGGYPFSTMGGDNICDDCC